MAASYSDDVVENDDTFNKSPCSTGRLAHDKPNWNRRGNRLEGAKNTLEQAMHEDTGRKRGFPLPRLSLGERDANELEVDVTECIQESE